MNQFPETFATTLEQLARLLDEPHDADRDSLMVLDRARLILIQGGLSGESILVLSTGAEQKITGIRFPVSLGEVIVTVQVSIPSNPFDTQD